MCYRAWTRSSSLRPSDSYGDGHWVSFQETRRKHNENICHQTNELILVLDRLLNSQDLDKSIVEWTSDSLVQLCPFCAKSFSFARRKHHCRTCGAILCHDCSRFLEHKAALKLIKPKKIYTDPYDRIDEQLELKGADEKPKIRTCEDCQRLLDKRIQTIEAQYCQPVFYELYEKLREVMGETDKLILSRNSILLEQKQPPAELVSQIQDLKHKVTVMSSKLSKMAQKESGKQAHLLSSIGQSVAYWLKESIESKDGRFHGSRPAGNSSGWVPMQASQSGELDEDKDPYMIQLENLDEYIKQARLAGRYEELTTLEEARRNLEIECLIRVSEVQSVINTTDTTG